ncbi:MAG: hypothetical protein AB9891_17535 [Anaerolineaceae bacterium]
MKRALFSMLLFLIILSSCGPSGPVPTATADPADIAVQVMLILTQDPVVIPTLPPPPIPEPTQEATPTPEGPTPEPSPTLEPSPTPTLPSTDPRNNLGEPTWREKFDRDKTGFYTFDDGHTNISLVYDFLKLTSINSNGWHGWSLGSPKPRNFYLEATFLPEACANRDRYGLVFRAPDYNTGYFFGVSCDGNYNLRVYDHDGDLIEWTQDDAILAGSNQKNRLGVMAEDNRIQLFINGEMVKELTDSTYTDSGLIGVFIAAQSTPGFTVRVDEIAYWTRP